MIEQSLEAVADQLINPLENLIWGGMMTGPGLGFREETSAIPIFAGRQF